MIGATIMADSMRPVNTACAPIKMMRDSMRAVS